MEALIERDGRDGRGGEEEREKKEKKRKRTIYPVKTNFFAPFSCKYACRSVPANDDG